MQNLVDTEFGGYKIGWIQDTLIGTNRHSRSDRSNKRRQFEIFKLISDVQFYYSLNN